MHLIRCIFVYITTFEIHRYFQVKRSQTVLFVLGQKFHLNIHFERNQKYIVTILPIYYNFEWRQFYECKKKIIGIGIGIAATCYGAYKLLSGKDPQKYSSKWFDTVSDEVLNA